MGNAVFGTGQGLRIVAFNVRAPAYALVADWAARHGHTIPLVVTTPGPPARRSTMYRDLIAAAPPEQQIVVTTRPKRLAPLVAVARPDLIICASFPYRIPPEVVAIPRLGAVNLHPSPLPRYRGPNPTRALYDGESHLWASLHRIAPTFDAGPILAQVARPIPDDATPEAIWAVLGEVLTATFEEGLACAIAGEPGRPQDETQATYAGAFTDAECWLDWREPRATLQRRATALNLDGPIARATIDGVNHTVTRITPLPEQGAVGAPGTVLASADGTFTVAAGDGAVLVAVE